MKFSKKSKRKLCRKCRKRPNVFSMDGVHYKRDRDHELCRQCYRSLQDADWQRRNAGQKPVVEQAQARVFGT